MPTYTPLRVRIGLDLSSGRALYPAFNTLPVVQASGMDWSKYVDVNGEGWLYDKVSGHRDEDAQSPRNQQWGILLVDATFVSEAVAAFPAECTLLTEAQLETFYDARIGSVEDDEDVDETKLERLRKQVQLVREGLEDDPTNQNLLNRLAALRARARALMDPSDEAAGGVTLNKRRNWQRLKAWRNITIA